MTPKCIIFDCDGTLVDSEYLTNSVIAQMASELGIEMTAEEATKTFGGKTLDAVIYKMKELSGSEIPADWLPRLITKVSDAYKTNLIPMDGIKDVLDLVTIPVCVASNGEPRHVNGSLTLTGLIDYFEGKIYTASDVGVPKPAPDFVYNMPPTENYPEGYKYKGEKRNTSGWNTVVVAGKIIKKIGPILAINNLQASSKF